jgi:putative ABC transport system permease protein
VLVQGHEPESSALKPVRIIQGRPLKPDDAAGVIIGSVLAGNIGKKAGEKIKLYEEEFDIVGIYESYNVFESSSIIMPISVLQRLMDRKGLVNGFSLVLRKPFSQEDLQRISKQIEAMQEGLSAMAAREHVDTIMEIRMTRAMAWLTSAVALVIGTVGIMNTMIMSVYERTHEIGVLRALGWRKTRIVRMIVIESVVLSIVGAVVGTLAAIVMVRVLTNLPNVQGLIAGRVDPEVVAQGFIVALTVGLLGGILPAIRATRMAPTTALRHE